MMIPYTKHSEIFHKYVFIKVNNTTTNNITLECHLVGEKTSVVSCNNMFLCSP